MSVRPFALCKLFESQVIGHRFAQFGPFDVGIGTSNCVNELIQVII
jgi:hypothetical protein